MAQTWAPCSQAFCVKEGFLSNIECFTVGYCLIRVCMNPCLTPAQTPWTIGNIPLSASLPPLSHVFPTCFRCAIGKARGHILAAQNSNLIYTLHAHVHVNVQCIHVHVGSAAEDVKDCSHIWPNGIRKLFVYNHSQRKRKGQGNIC